jgi:hypothetical protein
MALRYVVTKMWTPAAAALRSPAVSRGLAAARSQHFSATARQVRFPFTFDYSRNSTPEYLLYATLSRCTSMHHVSFYAKETHLHPSLFSKGDFKFLTIIALALCAGISLDGLDLQ